MCAYTFVLIYNRFGTQISLLSFIITCVSYDKYLIALLPQRNQSHWLNHLKPQPHSSPAPLIPSQPPHLTHSHLKNQRSRQLPKLYSPLLLKLCFPLLLLCSYCLPHETTHKHTAEVLALLATGSDISKSSYNSGNVSLLAGDVVSW